MTIAVQGGRRAVRWSPRTRHLWSVLVSCLVYAGAAHIALAATHAGTSFAYLAAAAGIAQIGVAVVATRTLRPVVAAAAIVLALVPLELYLLNVTVGLPPLIAHSHVPVTHAVLGVAVAEPNTIELPDVIVQIVELCAASTAALLLRATGAGARR